MAGAYSLLSLECSHLVCFFFIIVSCYVILTHTLPLVFLHINKYLYISVYLINFVRIIFDPCYSYLVHLFIYLLILFVTFVSKHYTYQFLFILFFHFLYILLILDIQIATSYQCSDQNEYRSVHATRNSEAPKSV